MIKEYSDARSRIEKLRRLYYLLLFLVLAISLANLLLTLGKIVIEFKSRTSMLDALFFLFWLLISLLLGYIFLHKRR